MMFAGLPYSILHVTEKVMANMSHADLVTWVQLVSENTVDISSNDDYQHSGATRGGVFRWGKDNRLCFCVSGLKKFACTQCRFSKRPYHACATEGCRASIGFFRDGGFAL